MSTDAKLSHLGQAIDVISADAPTGATTSLQALDPDQPGIVLELNEVLELAQLEISRRVGLPGLQITADAGR